MTGRGRESVTPNDGTENGPYTYGWLQSRIFDNGRKPDRATPRAGRRVSACKLLFQRRNASDCTLGIRSCKLRATPIKIGRIRHFGRMARPPRVISERESPPFSMLGRETWLICWDTAVQECARQSAGKLV